MMILKPKMKKAFRLSFYATENISAYFDYKYDIAKLNLTFCKATSALAVIISVLALICSFLFDTYTDARYVYVAMLAVSVTAIFFIWLFVKDHLSFALPTLYVGNIIIYSHTILLGTFYSTDYNAVVYLVMLISLSILIADKPYRVYILSLLSGLAFVLSSFFLKERSVFVLDLVNTAVAMIVSIFITNTSMRLRLDNIIKGYELQSQIETDNLTKLYTRTSLENKVSAREDYEGTTSALLLLDIDDFKSVNDIFGHSVGDKILVMIADTMRQTFGEENYCARIGGDEFIVFCPNAQSIEAVSSLTEKFLEAVKSNGKVEDSDYGVTCSVGIVCPMPENFDKAYKQADAAMYSAKRNGKNTYFVF